MDATSQKGLNLTPEQLTQIAGLATGAGAIVAAPKDKKNSAIGGAMGAGLGMVSNALVPGLGTILTPVLSSVGTYLGAKIDDRENFRKEFSNTYNQQILENGGQLQSKNGLYVYDGPSHAKGGININERGMLSSNSNIEVEGGESLFFNPMNKSYYIFSNKLKNNEK